MNSSGVVYNPRLIEPGVKSFINSTLKDCRRLKDNYETIIFNISMFCVFILVVGGFLLYHYRGKLTPAEIEIKNRKKQEYIISKLQQMAHLRKNQGLITDLPRW
jgi:hypothetical protein